jgi:hypothetical protein
MSAQDMDNGQQVVSGGYQVTLLPVSPQRIGFGMRLDVPGNSNTREPQDSRVTRCRPPDSRARRPERA